MAPFRGQPRVVEVEPANHGAYIECGLNRIELKAGAGDARAVGNDGSRNDGAEQFGARRIFKRLKSAAERIDQAITRSGVRKIAFDLEIQRIVGDVGEDF